MQVQAPGDPIAQRKLVIAAYDKMGKALQATGRPIVYSICQYGHDSVWEWGPSVGANLWRTTNDLYADWFHIALYGFSQAGLNEYARPGHWNDPDMLEVGNGNLTLAENRSHFSLWAMLAAPLIAGNNLPQMTPDIASILTNRDIIALDQDPLGRQGNRAYAEGEMEVWTRHLANGALAICVINNGSDRLAGNPFLLRLARLNLKERAEDHPLAAKDLWTGQEIILKDRMPILLASHAVLLLRIDSRD
jgi:alpha-galactosidase